ncbi:MAG: hypothetical protein CMQ20_01640 [Gammaproteobacteria bacterium]|nr:hypothetical protein [Gammaproteobacteria bacterium]
MSKKFAVTLRKIHRLSQTTLWFRFERNDGGLVSFEPGQFFRFVFTDGAGDFERAYSPCNFAEGVANIPYLDLVISYVDGGRASQHLFNCDEGVRATAGGPFGRLVLPRKLPARLFLVATSVGIAPFMPILKALAPSLEKQELEVVLLFGARTRDDFLFHEEISAIDDKFDSFTLKMCYSREAQADSKANEINGYVTGQIAGFSPDPESDKFMLCGNPRMIDDCFGLLKELGFTAKQVVREKYVYAKKISPQKSKVLTADQKRLIAEKVNKYR